VCQRMLDQLAERAEKAEAAFRDLREDEPMEVREARKALRCLYLEVSESVAQDVSRRVEAAFAALRDLRETSRRESVEDIQRLLVDVAQIFDGWHADGTAWTEWDESVRKRVSAALREKASE
jgi:phage-related baseplate assembly protein